MIDTAVSSLIDAVKNGDVSGPQGAPLQLKELSRVFLRIKQTPTTELVRTLTPPLLALTTAPPGTKTPLHVSAKAARLLERLWKCVPPEDPNDATSCCLALGNSLRTLLAWHDSPEAGAAGMESMQSFVVAATSLVRIARRFAKPMDAIPVTARKSVFSAAEPQELAWQSLLQPSRIMQSGEVVCELVRLWAAGDVAPDLDALAASRIARSLQYNGPEAATALCSQQQLLQLVFARVLCSLGLVAEDTPLETLASMSLRKKDFMILIAPLIKGHQKFGLFRGVHCITAHFVGKLVACILATPQPGYALDAANSQLSLLLGSLANWYADGTRMVSGRLAEFIYSLVHTFCKLAVARKIGPEREHTFANAVAESALVPLLFSGQETGKACKALCELSALSPHAVCNHLLRMATPALGSIDSGLTARPVFEARCALQGITVCARSLFRESGCAIPPGEFVTVAVQSLNANDTKRTKIALELIFCALVDSPIEAVAVLLSGTFFDTLLTLVRALGTAKTEDDTTVRVVADKTHEKALATLLCVVVDALLCRADRESFGSMFNHLVSSITEFGAAAGPAHSVGLVCNSFVRVHPETVPQLLSALLERRTSSTTETWSVRILYHAIARSGAGLLPHIEAIERVLDSCLTVESEHDLCVAAATLLDNTLASLSYVYPLSYDNEQSLVHVPTEAELTCAKRIAQKYSATALAHLESADSEWRQTRIDLSVIEAVLHGAAPLFGPISRDEFRQRVSGILVQSVLKQVQSGGANPSAVERLPRVIVLLVCESKPFEEELNHELLAYKKLCRVWKPATKETFPQIPRLSAMKSHIKRMRLLANLPLLYAHDELTGRLVAALTSLCSSKELPGTRNDAVTALRNVLRSVPEFALSTAGALIARIGNDSSGRSNPDDPESGAVASACNVLCRSSALRHRIVSRGDLLKQLLHVIASGKVHEGHQAQAGFFHLVGVCISAIDPFSGNTPLRPQELETIATDLTEVTHDRWRAAVLAAALFVALLPVFPTSAFSMAHVTWLTEGSISAFAPIRELSIRALGNLLCRNAGLVSTAAEAVNVKLLLTRAIASRSTSLAEEEESEADAVTAIARRFGFNVGDNGNGDGIARAAGMLASASSGIDISQRWPTLPAPPSSVFSAPFADVISTLAVGTSAMLTTTLTELRSTTAAVDSTGLQCVEAEVFAGIARNNNIAEHQDKLAGMLLAGLKAATPATLACWLTAVRYVARHRPTVTPWLVSTLVGDALAANGTSPQRIAKLLDAISELLIEQQCEITLPLNDLVCNDHAAVRTAAMRVVATLSTISHGRNEVATSAINAACAAAIVNPDDPHGSAVPEFVQYAMRRRWPEALRGCYTPIVAALLALRMAKRDAEVISAAGRALGLLSVGTRAHDGLWKVDDVLNAFGSVLQPTATSSTPSHWRVRAAVMPLLAVTMHNLGALATPQESHRALQLAVSQLGDTQSDVRDAAIQALSAMLSRAPLVEAVAFATTQLLDGFERMATARSSSNSDRLHGTAGLAALLRAWPHTVPTHVPKVVTILGRIAARSDAAGTTATQALQSFWSSHLRWWDTLWAPLFTADQVDAIRSHASRSSAGSYFA